MINIFRKRVPINIKDKKGFTLVEIIICIALIIMISTLSIIVLKKETENSKYQEYITLASMTYDEIKQYEQRCIKLEYIIKDGYLAEENIKDEDKNKYITISSNEEGYKDYTITSSCTERLKITLNDENNLSYLYFDIETKKWHINSTITSSIDKVSIPTKANKFFGGFFSEKDGNGENIINDTGIIDTSKDLTDSIILYAYWINTYTVYLDNAGGSPSSSSLFYKKDSWYMELDSSNKITSIDNIPKKTAHKFDGYYKDVSDLTTQYIDSNGNIDTNKFIDSDISLYAKWIQKKYKVSLNNNGATGAGTNTIYLIYNDKWYSNSTYENTITSITKPTKNGYSFSGYFTENNGSGEQIINKDGNILDGKTTFTTIDEDNVNLYANWNNGIYRIALNDQGATTSGTSEIYLKYNNGWCDNESCSKSINKITIPIRKGYVFNGYYTSTDGKGTQIIDKNGNLLEQKNFTTSNTTIYAYWTPITYTILFGGKITELPVGTTVTVRPNKEFSVSGNNSAYTKTIIDQNGNEAESLQIKIQFYLTFRGYAAAVKRTCKMTYQASYNGNYLLNFYKEDSCITMSGYEYKQPNNGYTNTFNFDDDGKIVFNHFLKLNNTTGRSNTLTLKKIYITILSEN